MKKIEVWESEDGKLFRTKTECKQHEASCRLYNDFKEIWSKYHDSSYVTPDVFEEEDFINEVCEKYGLKPDELCKVPAFNRFETEHLLPF